MRNPFSQPARTKRALGRVARTAYQAMLRHDDRIVSADFKSPDGVRLALVAARGERAEQLQAALDGERTEPVTVTQRTDGEQGMAELSKNERYQFDSAARKVYKLLETSGKTSLIVEFDEASPEPLILIWGLGGDAAKLSEMVGFVSEAA